MGVPAGAGHGGGAFTVEIVDCDFELNELDGARVDIDYDFFPEWNATILVRGLPRARQSAPSACTWTSTRAARPACTACGAAANRGDGWS
jgi:hypothetical protein